MKIIFDLDGTLSNPAHRLHLIRNTKTPNWDRFSMLSEFDDPVPQVIALFKTLHAIHDVVVWSGRSDIAREVTEQWFKQHIGFVPEIKMRKQGDYTPDQILKQSWLHECKPRPDMVFDDRQRVVDMWRANGVICCQVAAWHEADKTSLMETIIEPLKPEAPMLTVMVGPSGAGKSSVLKYLTQDVTDRIAVISSDEMRVKLCGDMQDQSRNSEVFAACHRLIKENIRCGIPVYFDATNLRTKDRRAVVDLCPPEYRVEYWVVNRPMEDKIKTAGWRNDVTVKDGKSLLQYHEDIFQSNLKDILAGDNYPNVKVWNTDGHNLECAK